MNDQRKTKKQLLEDLQRERERSIALQEVSNKMAAAYNTNEVLNLIAKAAGRLVHTDAAYIRLLEGENLAIRANTDPIAGYLADTSAVEPEEGTTNAGHVMATKKPLVMEAYRETGNQQCMG